MQGMDPTTKAKQTEILTKLEEIKVLVTLPQDLTNTGDPTFVGATLTGLTPSQIVFTGADKSLVSGASDVTAAELEELSDGSETALHSHVATPHTIASHSDTTGTGAELEELTDGSETTLHSHASAGPQGDVPVIVDSESQTLVKSHAYLTQTSGFVQAFYDVGYTAAAIYAYVGITTNPQGDGECVGKSRTAATGIPFVSFFVGEGKYFEIISTEANLRIVWIPLVAGGGAPIDQD